MIFTDEQNLPCLEGTDYADYALYMKCLAEQLDVQIGAEYNSFTGFIDRPTGLWTAGAVQSLPNSGQIILFDFSGPSASANWPDTFPGIPTLGNLRGWWHIGCNVNAIATGAVTANTFRKLELVYTPPADAGINFGPVSFIELVYESNTGNGENLCASGTVYCPGSLSTLPGADGGSFLGFFSNGNTGSNLTTTLTPPVAFWATFLGDTPVIGS